MLTKSCNWVQADTGFNLITDHRSVFEKPTLVTVVDTEEEFDWSQLSVNCDDVTNVAHQQLAHTVFERHGVIPTYLVDFPVAAQEDGFKPLLELYQSGKCAIGAQMHPWVNPPFDETVSIYNSYAGNLPRHLEREKLVRLTQEITSRFDCTPIVYRAGRYGLGPNTPGTLVELGYRVDMSVLPRTDLSPTGGPDFSGLGPMPFWFSGEKDLLEVPQTVEILGTLGSRGAHFYRLANNGWARTLKAPGLLARLRLLDRITLTPEGVKLPEAKRLTRELAARGQRVFVLSYHSPSLHPGHTPYVRSQKDLQAFLAWLDGYFDFFCREIGGDVATVEDVYRKLASTAGPVAIPDGN
jgi:hypothetical protein